MVDFCVFFYYFFSDIHLQNVNLDDFRGDVRRVRPPWIRQWGTDRRKSLRDSPDYIKLIINRSKTIEDVNGPLYFMDI